MDSKPKLHCICKPKGCRHGVPDYCVAHDYRDEIDRARQQYSTPDNLAIYEAASIVGSKNDGFRPRIEEALDFCAQLKLTRIGFAACNAFESELALLRALFTERGFEVVAVACQIGRVTAEQRGTPHLAEYTNANCNPIAQAEILNAEGTELNFIVGLCMGHDILFTRHSNAPVSTLIVKDRMMGNNPAAALYGYHARRSLFGLKRKDDRMV